LLLFDFLVWSENFKVSVKKENKVPRAFLSGLFIWPNWELEDQTFQAIFCTLVASIVPPRSLELKLEAKKPSMEEAMRCELKLPVKRTARIHCGGRVPTGALASRNPVEGEKVPTPIRRSARIQGMKRKDYKEASPEPKDYEGSDYSDDRSPSSWAAAGRDDDDWDEQPKERLPKAPTATVTMATKAAMTMVVATMAVTMVEIMATTTPSDCIRFVVELAVNPSRISTRRPMNVSKPWKR
jgi:hypothetical protein